MARVLFVVTSETTVRAFGAPITSALEDAGHDVLVACGGEVSGPEIETLPLARSGNPLDVVRAAVGLARLVRRQRPDAIVCATPVASFLGVWVGRLLRVPTVVYLAWGLRSESLVGPARTLVGAAERLTAAGAHVILANSPSLRDAIQASAPRSAQRVECLGSGSSHGVDIALFRPSARESSAVRIGFVGRIRRDKGIVELLEAADRMQARGVLFELDLFGSLEDESLAELLAQHPIANVHGPRSDISRVMGELDVLCLPSWREGFPNVVLEASASGIPVVTTDATGARDSVRDGKTGFVVGVRDSAALESALTLLVQDAGLREKFGAAGRAWVEREFEQKFVCHRLARRITLAIP